MRRAQILQNKYFGYVANHAIRAVDLIKIKRAQAKTSNPINKLITLILNYKSVSMTQGQSIPLNIEVLDNLLLQIHSVYSENKSLFDQHAYDIALKTQGYNEEYTNGYAEYSKIIKLSLFKGAEFTVTKFAQAVINTMIFNSNELFSKQSTANSWLSKIENTGMLEELKGHQKGSKESKKYTEIKVNFLYYKVKYLDHIQNIQGKIITKLPEFNDKSIKIGAVSISPTLAPEKLLTISHAKSKSKIVRAKQQLSNLYLSYAHNKKSRFQNIILNYIKPAKNVCKKALGAVNNTAKNLTMNNIKPQIRNISNKSSNAIKAVVLKFTYKNKAVISTIFPKQENIATETYHSDVLSQPITIKAVHAATNDPVITNALEVQKKNTVNIKELIYNLVENYTSELKEILTFTPTITENAINFHFNTDNVKLKMQYLAHNLAVIKNSTLNYVRNKATVIACAIQDILTYNASSTKVKLEDVMHNLVVIKNSTLNYMRNKATVIACSIQDILTYKASSTQVKLEDVTQLLTAIKSSIKNIFTSTNSIEVSELIYSAKEAMINIKNIFTQQTDKKTNINVTTKTSITMQDVFNQTPSYEANQILHSIHQSYLEIKRSVMTLTNSMVLNVTNLALTLYSATCSTVNIIKYYTICAAETIAKLINTNNSRKFDIVKHFALNTPNINYKEKFTKLTNAFINILINAKQQIYKASYTATYTTVKLATITILKIQDAYYAAKNKFTNTYTNICNSTAITMTINTIENTINNIKSILNTANIKNKTYSLVNFITTKTIHAKLALNLWFNLEISIIKSDLKLVANHMKTYFNTLFKNKNTTNKNAAIEEKEENEQLIIEIERLESARLESARLEAARIEAARIEAAKLEAAKLEAAKLEAARLEAAKLETAKLEAARLEAARLEAARLEAAKLEAARLEAARLEAARLEAAKLEAARLEAAKLEAARLEAAKLEAAKLEAARLEAAKLEAARLEAARIEAARLEAAKLEAARLEAAKLEAAKLEAVKLEAARLESAKLEAAKLEAEEAKIQLITPINNNDINEEDNDIIKHLLVSFETAIYNTATSNNISIPDAIAKLQLANAELFNSNSRIGIIFKLASNNIL